MHGVFLFLTRNGVRLGVRDYEDALTMLRAGYGFGSRESLFRLCKTLWTRSDEDVRLLDTLFKQFSYPTYKEIIAAAGEDEEEEEDDDGDRPDAVEESDPLEEELILEEEESGAVPAIQFGPGGSRGLGLNRAQLKVAPGEAFILVERPIIPLRFLIIAWRRFRVAARGGPKVEFDLGATIAEQCRRGRLETPVLLAARRNQARLIVLLDASSSMAPWKRLNHILIDSLKKGQLGSWAVYYFNNVPGDVLYRDESMSDPVTVEDALTENPDHTLLVVSDGGGARGFHKPERVEQTESFVSRVWDSWRPVVWANTLPRDRWAGSSAEAISGLPNVSMLEFSEEGLLKAVDILRGYDF